MSTRSIDRGTARAASALAAAAVAVGLLAVPGTAEAMPLQPLAPNCDKFTLSNDGIDGLTVILDNGIFARIPVSAEKRTEVGTREAWYRSPGVAHTYGTAYGSLSGRSINMTTKWNKGPGTGFSNIWTGQIEDQGISTGTVTNNRGVTNKWRGTLKHSCLDTPAPPAPAPPAPAPPAPAPPAPPKVIGKQKTATVTTDTDLYDKPSHEGGKKIGVLRQGDVAKVVTPCQPEAWCELREPKGWAWGRDLKNNN
jgi:hypothetical protein